MSARCEVCGRKQALFVCSRCGRKVCRSCFDPITWMCSSCREAMGLTPAPGPGLPFSWLAAGLALIFLGSLLTALGFLLAGQQGFVVVFPFFVLAGGPAPAYLIILFAVMALLVVLLLIVMLVRPQIFYRL